VKVSQSQEPRELRVLVVEDCEDAAIAEATLLELIGHAVRVARDGFSALELVQAFRPHVVLLDIGLPGMDGNEVARRIRALSTAPMKIIAVTGYGRADDRDKTAAAGIDHHLLKPVETSVLQSMLNTITRDLHSQGDIGRPPPNNGPSSQKC
jgi:CheY-like chemotaxis protein